MMRTPLRMLGRQRFNIQTQLVLISLVSLVLAAVVTLVLASALLGIDPPPGDLLAISRRVPTIEQVLAANGDAAALRQAAVPPDLSPGVRVRLVAANGSVRADSAVNAVTDLAPASTRDLLGWFAPARQAGTAQVIQAVPVILNGQTWGYYLVLSSGLGPAGLNSSGVLALVFGLGLLAGVLPLWWFGRGLVRGVGDLTAVVGQIAAGDLAARTDANLQQRRDELGRLANDVNAMAASLQEAQRRVRSGDEARRFMVAAVSHDLRTPLTALMAHTEAMRAGLSEDPRQSLDVIYTRAVRLKSLIDDLFELAALDASLDPWPTRRTDLAEVVREAVAAALPDFESAGLEVDVEISDEPAWADLTPGKLERVIDNLLVNARVYGSAGHWLRVRVGRVDAGAVRVEVWDRGTGISAADRAHIFERFYRSDGARRVAVGGSGLGLAIAREIVVRHRGQIGVESPADGGACFWFEVPSATG